MAPIDDAPGGARPGKSPANHRRVLRAVFAADIAGFSGQMSLNETTTVSALSEIMTLGRDVLDQHDGWLFGMPGDGLFALFESAVSAVQCALQLQQELAVRPRLAGLPLRVGIHLGEVLIENEIPYGEALNVAARLESLAEPGSILVSGTVMDAVSSRISATFEDRGVPQLKNIPRRIPTFAVKPPPPRSTNDETHVGLPSLDRTTRLDRNALREVLDMRRNADALSSAAQAADEPAAGSGGNREALPQNATVPAQAAAPTTTENEPAARASIGPVVASGAAVRSTTADPRSDDELLDQIKIALAVHLGPLAKLIVDREIKSTPSTAELIAKLADHIPNDEERKAFQAGVSRIMGAGHSSSPNSAISSNRS
jgi:class 3 adenylate cyclase